MGFPDPGHYGVDPKDFSGRDAGLGRYYYGDGGGMRAGRDGDSNGPGHPGAAGCLKAILSPWGILLLVLVGILVWGGVQMCSIYFS